MKTTKRMSYVQDLEKDEAIVLQLVSKEKDKAKLAKKITQKLTQKYRRELGDVVIVFDETRKDWFVRSEKGFQHVLSIEAIPNVILQMREGRREEF